MYWVTKGHLVQVLQTNKWTRNQSPGYQPWFCHQNFMDFAFFKIRKVIVSTFTQQGTRYWDLRVQKDNFGHEKDFGNHVVSPPISNSLRGDFSFSGLIDECQSLLDSWFRTLSTNHLALASVSFLLLSDWSRDLCITPMNFPAAPFCLPATDLRASYSLEPWEIDCSTALKMFPEEPLYLVFGRLNMNLLRWVSSGEVGFSGKLFSCP